MRLSQAIYVSQPSNNLKWSLTNDRNHRCCILSTRCKVGNMEYNCYLYSLARFPTGSRIYSATEWLSWAKSCINTASHRIATRGHVRGTCPLHGREPDARGQWARVRAQGFVCAKNHTNPSAVWGDQIDCVFLQSRKNNLSNILVSPPPPVRTHNMVHI